MHCIFIYILFHCSLLPLFSFSLSLLFLIRKSFSLVSIPLSEMLLVLLCGLKTQKCFQLMDKNKKPMERILKLSTKKKLLQDLNLRSATFFFFLYIKTIHGKHSIFNNHKSIKQINPFFLFLNLCTS